MSKTEPTVQDLDAASRKLHAEFAVWWKRNAVECCKQRRGMKREVVELIEWREFKSRRENPPAKGFGDESL